MRTSPRTRTRPVLRHPRSGSIRPSPTRASPSSVSRGPRPSRSRSGPERACRRKPSGRKPRGAVSRVPATRGARPDPPPRSIGHRESARRRRTPSGSPTSPVSVTSGVPTGSTRATTRSRPGGIRAGRPQEPAASAVAEPGGTPTRGARSVTAPPCRPTCATPTTACDSRGTPSDGGRHTIIRTEMASAERSILREGVVAGLIGAVVVAVWFLAFDIARGKPFLTPGLLGAAVFQGVTNPTGLEITVANVVGYTLIHGLAFIAFGVVAASLMAISEREPTLFVAFVILFAAFEVFFFGVVGALGRSMLGALVWWAILIGNLLASLAMLWYLFRAHRALPRTLVGSCGGVLRERVVAGLIGAVVVAVWFLAIDAIQGEPLRTPKLLGTALLRQPAPTAAVLSYTVVHGLAS